MAGKSISIGEVGRENYSRSQSPLPFLLARFRTYLQLQSTPRGRKEACRIVFAHRNAVDFGISPACLAREFVKNGIEHKQVAKRPVNGIEPKALGLSVKRELQRVCPEVLMHSKIAWLRRLIRRAGSADAVERLQTRRT